MFFTPDLAKIPGKGTGEVIDEKEGYFAPHKNTAVGCRTTVLCEQRCTMRWRQDSPCEARWESIDLLHSKSLIG